MSFADAAFATTMQRRVSEQVVGFEYAPDEDTLPELKMASALLIDVPTVFMRRLSSCTDQPVDCEASATHSAERPPTGEFGPRRVIRLTRHPASRAATRSHTRATVATSKRRRARPCTTSNPSPTQTTPLEQLSLGESRHMSENGQQNMGRATYTARPAQSRPDICTTFLQALPKRRPPTVRSFSRVFPGFDPGRPTPPAHPTKRSGHGTNKEHPDPTWHSTQVG
jgi:hypothetical protein